MSDMNDTNARITKLIDYLFVLELRSAHYSQLDIVDILACHERAHLNAVAVIAMSSDEQIDKLLE